MKRYTAQGLADEKRGKSGATRIRGSKVGAIIFLFSADGGADKTRGQSTSMN